MKILFKKLNIIFDRCKCCGMENCDLSHTWSACNRNQMKKKSDDVKKVLEEYINEQKNKINYHTIGNSRGLIIPPKSTTSKNERIENELYKKEKEIKDLEKELNELSLKYEALQEKYEALNDQEK